MKKFTLIYLFLYLCATTSAEKTEVRFISQTPKEASEVPLLFERHQIEYHTLSHTNWKKKFPMPCSLPTRLQKKDLLCNTQKIKTLCFWMRVWNSSFSLRTIPSTIILNATVWDTYSCKQEPPCGHAIRHPSIF